MSNQKQHSDAEPTDLPLEQPYSRGTLERLLDGHSTRSTPLAALVNAARAPGTAHENAGLAAALLAYTSAPPAAPVIGVHKSSAIKRVATKLFATKILAVIGVATAGGVALAASAGHLPSPWAPAPSVVPAVSRTGSTGDIAATAAAPRPTSARSSAPQTPSTVNGPSAATTTQVRSLASPPITAAPAAFSRLCRAWLAHSGSKVKANSSPAFAALVAAAGGPDRVTPYCAQVLAESTPASPGTSTATVRQKTKPNTKQKRTSSSPSHTTGATYGVNGPAEDR